ncbi:MAG: hydroxyacid dehydrogenase [Eubacterium sp.]|nr:hydroxyacid dehydrogenase [Eubacterium sp.]
MKRTILLTNQYQGTPFKILEEAVGDDFYLLMLPRVDKEALLEAIGQADYLLVSGRLKVDRDLVLAAKKLRMVQRTGVGLDNIDLDALKNCGIPLYVNRGVNAISVAEHTVMLMLSALKKSYMVNRQMRDGIWKKQETGLKTHEIFGRTIGLIGMGHIGKLTAQRLSAFGVKIIYYDRIRLSPEEERSLGVSYLDQEALLRQADILSLHCGLNKDNEYLINRKSIALMKDGAVLVNTARGRLVCEDDLADALASGKISACGIDTFEEEPPKSISRLAAFDQALLSPHIGGVSYEAFSRMMEKAVYNISMYDQGRLEEIEGNRIIG